MGARDRPLAPESLPSRHLSPVVGTVSMNPIRVDPEAYRPAGR